MLKLQFTCEEHLDALTSCSLLEIYCMWWEWIEAGVYALDCDNYSKALFYFGNARDVAIAGLSKAEIMSDTVDHLVAATILTVFIFQSRHQFEYANMCLSQSLHTLGYYLHRDDELIIFSEGIGVLLDSTKYQGYIEKIFTYESIDSEINLSLFNEQVFQTELH